MESICFKHVEDDYASGLKIIGDGNVKVINVTMTRLTDDTPAVEYLVDWFTKNGVALKTQVLTIYKDDYSISMGSLIWAGNLPDKQIFYSIKFK